MWKHHVCAKVLCEFACCPYVEGIDALDMDGVVYLGECLSCLGVDPSEDQ